MNQKEAREKLSAIAKKWGIEETVLENDLTDIVNYALSLNEGLYELIMGQEKRGKNEPEKK